MPELITNGYTAIALPSGYFHVMYFEGTPEEVRRQIAAETEAVSGIAHD